MKLDMEYIDKWSLGLDFKILFKTAPAVLKEGLFRFLNKNAMSQE